MNKKLTISLLGLFLPTLAKAQTVNLDLSITAAPFGQASQDASVLYGRDGNVLRQIGVTAAGELKTSGTIIPAYVTVNVESIVTVKQGAKDATAEEWDVHDEDLLQAVLATDAGVTNTAQNTADLLAFFNDNSGEMVGTIQNNAIGSNVRSSMYVYDASASTLENAYATIPDITSFDGSMRRALTSSNVEAQAGVELPVPNFPLDGDTLNDGTRMPPVAALTLFDNGSSTSQNVNPTNGLPENLVQQAGTALSPPIIGISTFPSMEVNAPVVAGLMYGLAPGDTTGQQVSVDLFGANTDAPYTAALFANATLFMGTNPVSPSNPVNVTGTVTTIASQATANSLENTTTTTFPLKTGGSLLQNYTLTAKWNGAVTADTFTATLEGSPTGDFAGEEVVLATVNQAGLSAGAQLKPYAYTRVNLSALTLVTADSLDLYATGLQ